jgi:hypothetical protein
MAWFTSVNDIQNQIDDSINTLSYTGTVESIEDLPESPAEGSFAHVISNSASYVFTNNEWQSISSTGTTINGLTYTDTDIDLGGTITTDVAANDNVFISPGITYRDYDTTIPVNEGAYLTYDGTDVQWTATNISGALDSLWINKFSLFGNDFISIDESGKVLVEGKQTDNPTKIGVALLKAINKIIDNEKIKSFDEI